MDGGNLSGSRLAWEVSFLCGCLCVCSFRLVREGLWLWGGGLYASSFVDFCLL